MDSPEGSAKCPRDVDVTHRVRAVHGVAPSKSTPSLLNGAEMSACVTELDPKCTPPHGLEIVRFLEVTVDGAMLKLVRISDVSSTLLQRVKCFCVR